MISICPGFKACGICAGIKKNDAKDLGLIYSEVPATAAGVFTRNKVQAAPVVFDKRQLKKSKCQAIIVNSGNANCCTGEQGLNDAQTMAESTAKELSIDHSMVLVASTGVIGQALPIAKIVSAVPHLKQTLSSEGFGDFAEAIMTTDTFPKLISRQGVIDNTNFTVTGVAKGSGMIRPDMATMLCYVCTDIDASPDQLHRMLKSSVDGSFNQITVDGDTSTNDMVIAIANGYSGLALSSDSVIDVVQKTFDSVLKELAAMIVKDGEGATKYIEIIINGAMSDADARKIADTVAHSNLVKTAFYGEDANWGRIIAAVGRADVMVDPEKIDIYFDHVLMVENGLGQGASAEAEATRVLKQNKILLTIDLKLGDGLAQMQTCDFSIDYVKINADYRS